MTNFAIYFFSKMKNNLNLIIALLLKKVRLEKNLSQDQLADLAELDRTYISGIERGTRNITIKTLSTLLSALDLELINFVNRLQQEISKQNQQNEKNNINSQINYKIRNDLTNISIKSGFNEICLIDQQFFIEALEETHYLIDLMIKEVPVDIFSILGMRNLSSFIGELFVKSFQKVANDLFINNPHQDGYPDLLLMNNKGKEIYQDIIKTNRIQEKAPFSPFINGGIEVKATCGSVPSPKDCAKKGLKKPEIGDSRIELLKGYDWKAHHRETNNLIGLLWDFIDQVPRIVALFFCNNLTEEDWGKIVQPKENAGRTTSVSIMTRQGVKKMSEHWILVINDSRYINFINQYNKVNLILEN